MVGVLMVGDLMVGVFDGRWFDGQWFGWSVTTKYLAYVGHKYVNTYVPLYLGTEASKARRYVSVTKTIQAPFVLSWSREEKDAFLGPGDMNFLLILKFSTRIAPILEFSK
jgi:hypothetical protein